MTGTETLTISMFGVVVALTLYITFIASRKNATAADFYSGGRSFSGFQNGLAISGDYMSAASFLGISGAIALNGYDGFLYSIGFLVAWLVALLLVAELLRNTGRYTMADVLSYRMKQRPVRTAAATSTVVVSIFYLLAQMAGAGALVSLLIGATSESSKNLTIVAVGALMIIYVTVGGMRGTTYVQIVKACLLMGGTTIVVFLTLLKFDFNISRMLDEASERDAREKLGAGFNAASGEVREFLFLGGGAQYGLTGTTKIDFISLALALVLGTAGLPHILIRFYTVPTARDARVSVLWAIGIIGTFYLMTLVLGFGAAALLGRNEISAAGGAGNLASPLLAEEVGGGDGSAGGAILLALISAVAFATILAVVAGLTLASSSSFSHDLYANVIKNGNCSEQEEIKVARIAAFGIGAVSIVLSLGAKNLNIAFLVALAFAVAASANLPSILLNLFWARFNTRGATWAIYGGLIVCIGLIVFSPNVSGEANSLFKCNVDAATKLCDGTGSDWSYFPLKNPGIISIPAGFLFGIIGTLTSKEPESIEKYKQFEVRALTGAGAEGAVQH